MCDAAYDVETLSEYSFTLFYVFYVVLLLLLASFWGFGLVVTRKRVGLDHRSSSALGLVNN